MAWSPSVTLVTGNSITAAYWNSTVGMANSPPTARATLSSAISPYTSGNTILFNSTSANLGFANGPTLSGGQLTVGTAGIYQVSVGINIGWGGGTMSAWTLNLFANIGGTAYTIGQNAVGWVASGFAGALQAFGFANLGASDYVYANFTFSGATSLAINAASQTALSVNMIGVL